MIGFIVKVERELINSVIRIFEDMPHISVHSIKDEQIMLLLDTDDINVLSQKIKEIQALDGVFSIYPVFSCESLNPEI